MSDIKAEPSPRDKRFFGPGSCHCFTCYLIALLHESAVGKMLVNIVCSVSLGSFCFSPKQCWGKVPDFSQAHKTEVQLNWFSDSL